MANGHEPSCAQGCANYVHRGPANVRDPASESACRLHRVKLPYAETDQLLICREWTDRRTMKQLDHWREVKMPLAGTLYAYPSIYAPNFVEYAKLNQLPTFDPGNDG
jgi:hypothetical protein